MVHKFDESLAFGQYMEQLLDDFFMRWFQIEEVTMDLQRLGIDRIFVKHATGERFSVEYKADQRASETGNVFIETVSVMKGETVEKLGWALTSTAQRLVYFIPGPNRVYILDMNDIRDMLPKWGERCKMVNVQNEGYVGKGLLVPITEIETHARGRMVIDG